MNNETTYNEGIVQELLRNFKTYWGELKTILQDDMQNNVLDKLAEVWYMEDAVTYWEQEVESWNNMCSSINKSFGLIYFMINNCARNYAQSCGATWQTSAWGEVDPKISNNFKAVSADGRRGITDHTSFDTYRTTNLDAVKENAADKLTQVVNACSRSGFVDDKTQETIQNEIHSIRTKIVSAIENEKNAIVSNSGISQDNVRGAAAANSSTSGN